MATNISAAERFAYGRPVATTDPYPVHVMPRSTAALVGRILLAAIFMLSGFAKLFDLNTTAGYMTQVGIPAAQTLAVIAGIIEIAGGVAILFGFLARLGALGLFLYLIPVTLIFHHFWTFEGAEQKTQLVNFMKNVAIMGGLLLLWAGGPARLSIDAAMRRPKEP
jgi:putative oxidoreductase